MRRLEGCIVNAFRLHSGEPSHTCFVSSSLLDQVYHNDNPGFAHFLALPFETEGFVSADVDRLLHGFAKLKVS